MKISLERKVRDAELMAHRLMQDTEERRNQENHYRSQIIPMCQGWPQYYLNSAQHSDATSNLNNYNPLRHSHAEMLYAATNVSIPSSPSNNNNDSGKVGFF